MRIRKEISPRTKASPAKASLSKKVNKRKTAPASQTQQKRQFLSINILYIQLSHHCVSINIC